MLHLLASLSDSYRNLALQWHHFNEKAEVSDNEIPRLENRKASKNFSDLQAELVDTEDKVQAARRFYNGGVRDLNTKIQLFPNNVFAGMLGFKQRDFFDVDESERATVDKVVDVDFDK